MVINYRIDSDFYGTARQLIRAAEGFYQNIYPDHIKVPTTGYGYALVIKGRLADGTYRYQRSPNLVIDFSKIGITVTQTNLNLINAIAKDLTEGKKEDAEAKIATLDAQIRDIDQPEASKLFKLTFDRALEDVKNGFIRNLNKASGELLFASMAGSTELVALASLAFTGGSGIIGSGLSRALFEGDRAEAWFEIRYGSNGGESAVGGLAKRRYAESQYFGLYDDLSNVNADEAKQIYRMLQLHRSAIEAYEKKYESQIGAANTDFHLGGTSNAVQSLINSLDPAKTALITDLRNTHPALASLDPENFTSTNIYLDPGRDNSTQTISADHIAVLDSRADSFGVEKTSADILIGEGGNDVLLGGKGNDILLGGAGLDTYIQTTGDGNDTLIDSDRKGRIILNSAANENANQAASLFIGVPGQAHTWKSLDGAPTLTRDGPGGNWLLSFEGGSIDLGSSLDQGQLGMRWIDTPVEPQINGSTLLGDRKPLTAEELAGQPPKDELGNVRTSDTPQVNRADTLSGSANNDHIQSLGGNDIIDGKDGDDYIEAGGGRDRVQGGQGADLLVGGEGSDILLGGAGKDVIYAESRVSLTQAWADGNTQQGTGERGDWLSGNDGDDILVGGRGNDVLYGEAGNDILAGNGDDDTLFGGDGDDVLYGDGIEIIGETERFAGNDYLDGGGGQNLLMGAEGDDSYIVRSADVTLAPMPEGQPQMLTTTIDDALGSNRIRLDVAEQPLSVVKVNEGYGLLWAANGGQAGVHLQNMGTAGHASVEFSDGRTVTVRQIVGEGLAQEQYVYSNSTDDVLIGGALNDELVGNGQGRSAARACRSVAMKNITNYCHPVTTRRRFVGSSAVPRRSKACLGLSVAHRDMYLETLTKGAAV